MKHFLLFLLLLHFCAKGQEIKKKFPNKTSAYFEILGNNLAYSLNYDKIIGQHQKYMSGYKIGLTPYINGFTIEEETALSMGYFQLYGKSNKFLEVGGGMNIYFDYLADNPDKLGSYLNLGYRKQGILGKPMIIRATFTPLIAFSMNRITDFDIELIGPWAGISIGYTFQAGKVEKLNQQNER